MNYHIKGSILPSSFLNFKLQYFNIKSLNSLTRCQEEIHELFGERQRLTIWSMRGGGEITSTITFIEEIRKSFGKVSPKGSEEDTAAFSRLVNVKTSLEIWSESTE